MRLLSLISQISIKSKTPTPPPPPPLPTIEEQMVMVREELKLIKQMLNDVQLIALNTQIEINK
jgi:hypothetical protein